MTSKEKIEMLDGAVKQLFVNECRSISYISKLLKIDRGTISQHIKENGYQQVNQQKKKIERFLNSYKEFIISKIKEGWTNKEICEYCHVGRLFFKSVIDYDKDIQEVKKLSNCTSNVEYSEIDGEEWKVIDGYNGYEVSNMGRIRHNNGLIVPTLNRLHDRYYVGLIGNDGKRHNLILSRVVAGAFCERKSTEDRTVNHKDGDKHNNKAENLEWVTQSENNLHSYHVLNRKHSHAQPIKYIIEYKGTYQFKTIAAFARFVGLGPTQAARWVKESPEEHEIRLLPKYTVTTIRKE